MSITISFARLVTVVNSITFVKFSEGNGQYFAFLFSPITVIHLGISTRLRRARLSYFVDCLNILSVHLIDMLESFLFSTYEGNNKRLTVLQDTSAYVRRSLR